MSNDTAITSVPAAPGTRARPATLADVAQLAGVSLGTASKALNGRGRLRDDTRARVEAAARTLSFQPNAYARSLLEGRTGTVGLLTNDLVGRFSLPILMGAEDALGAGNLSVLLCDARGDSIRQQFHLKALLQRRVDGIIVVGESAEPRPSLGTDIPVPVIYAYGPSQDSRDVSVISDDEESGYLAARHLLDSGRLRLAYLGGDRTYLAANRRAAGSRRAVEEAGLGFATDPLFGAWSEEWGRAGTRALLARAPEIDGLVCGSDQIARGALDALRDAAVDVPGDVAVIGHDDWEPLAAHSRPPLTSVDMNLELVGRRAAELLFDPGLADSSNRVHKIPSRVVVRQTTL